MHDEHGTYQVGQPVTREELDLMNRTIEELYDALDRLYRLQNGPPLYGREKDWRDAMAAAKKALVYSD